MTDSSDRKLKVIITPKDGPPASYVSNVSKEWTFLLSWAEHSEQLPMLVELITIYRI